MSGNGIVSALVFALASAAAATPGVVFRPGKWYRGLAKPSWCPPDWLFAPVWSVLYVTIAASGWLAWREAGTGGLAAFAVYGVHLVLNGLWSTVFFGLRRLGWALVEILCLWASIVATVVVFQPIDETAAYVLIPYLLWVTFAVALNFRVWQLNATLTPR